MYNSTTIGAGLGRVRASVILAWGLGGWGEATPIVQAIFKPVWRPRRHR